MINYVQRIKWFAGLVLFQVLVLNFAHISIYATPFMYIYFILRFDTGCGRTEIMLWSFALGLTVDIFSNTPGLGAAAATFLAFTRARLIRLVTLRELDEDFQPGMRTMGLAAYFRYALMGSLIFCTAAGMLEYFSMANISVLLLKILSNTAATLASLLCVEAVRRG